MASTSTELPKYPSFSLVKSEVHYPLSMGEAGERFRTMCIQFPRDAPIEELDYTAHADGNVGMSNIYDDDDEDEIPPAVYRRRRNVLSIISEEDLSSQQSMEEDIDADSRTNRSRPCEQEGDLNRKRKSKLGDAAKTLRQFFHRHARKLKKESRRVFLDSSNSLHPKCKKV